MACGALKRVIQRLWPEAAGARPIPSTDHPLDGALRGLYRADGSQSKAQFARETLPLFQALHREALRRDAATAEPAMQALLRTITGACQRAANERLPKGGQATDYRRYETLYNYALISAMAIAWHLDETDVDRGRAAVLAETFLPADGMARLQREALVWAHWQAFFEGGEDGGLRDIAGRSVGLGPCTADPGSPASRSNARVPVPDANAPDRAFSRPDRSQWAQPLARGWALVATIREGLQDGSLPYNCKRAWVHVDWEGRTFLQVPEVFEWCGERLDGHAHPKTLINQFARLNICTRTRKGHNLLRGGRRKQKHYQQGFVVEDPTLLWDGEPPHDEFVIRHLTQHSIGQPPQKPPA